MGLAPRPPLALPRVPVHGRRDKTHLFDLKKKKKRYGNRDQFRADRLPSKSDVSACKRYIYADGSNSFVPVWPQRFLPTLTYLPHDDMSHSLDIVVLRQCLRLPAAIAQDPLPSSQRHRAKPRPVAIVSVCHSTR